MKLGRSFFSLYFLIVACFGITNWLLDEIWNTSVEQDVESYTGYKTVLIALNEHLSRFPVDEWQEKVSAANQRYNLPLKLVKSADVHALLPDVDFVKGNGVTVYYDDDLITLFHPIDTYDLVLIMGPVESPTRPHTATIVRIGIVILLGVAIFFWVWPISRDLDKLDLKAKEFAHGDFNVTIDNANSMLVSPMIKTFNMMSSRINNLIEAHKELTNAVSHELRTPLARSKFALQILRNAKDDETREKYIDQINTDVEELELLVNELLVYAAFESEQPNVNFDTANIKSLIEYQVASFSHNDVEINFDCMLPELMAEYDGHFINRALSNLLSNAVKYGQGKLLVSLTTEGNDCVICVEDNGEGVADEFKEIIFDAFSRYDKSRGKDTGGFGLGLAIVSKIMVWHNGRAQVSDSSLGGAKFTLRWPLRHI